MSGIELARAYWADVVRPILDQELPGVRRAAGRLGGGSDVLGLDDDTSRDHDWGLRLTLLVPAVHVHDVDRVLAASLPASYRGRPTAFPVTWDPTVRHRVEIATPADFVRSRTGLDVGDGLTGKDWLSLTGQSVLEVTAGPIFEDTAGEITALRERLAWYPDDVWLHVLAADWTRVEQELPFVGRTGHRGDDVGSRLIAARLVTALVRLGFLLERRWPPYPKWAGTLRQAVTDPAVQALSHRGGVEQWVDDVGTLTDAAMRPRLAACS